MVLCSQIKSEGLKWSLDESCSPSQLMENFCLKKIRDKREKSKKAKEKYRPALAVEREAVWVDAWVCLCVGIHIHSKKSISIVLSMVSSRGIIVTVSVRAGLDLQCCSQGSPFCARFSHLCFYSSSCLLCRLQTISLHFLYVCAEWENPWVKCVASNAGRLRAGEPNIQSVMAMSHLQFHSNSNSVVKNNARMLLS